MKTVVARIMITAGLTLVACAASWAREDRDPGIEQREENQASRIARGVEFGSLTQEETAALDEKEKAFKALETSFKADGELTREERHTLQRQLNELSKDIFKEKHNSEVRGPDVPQNIRIRNRLGTGKLTYGDAREHIRRALRLIELRRNLNGKLSAEDRKKFRAEHDKLIDTLYERESAEVTPAKK